MDSRINREISHSCVEENFVPPKHIVFAQREGGTHNSSSQGFSGPNFANFEPYFAEMWQKKLSKFAQKSWLDELCVPPVAAKRKYMSRNG